VIVSRRASCSGSFDGVGIGFGSAKARDAVVTYFAKSAISVAVAGRR
jgi:hypothetical protein